MTSYDSKGPFRLPVVAWVPFASYTDGWGTHAFSDGNRTLRLDLLESIN